LPEIETELKNWKYELLEVEVVVAEVVAVEVVVGKGVVVV
jgi:hypothetical protein